MWRVLIVSGLIDVQVWSWEGHFELSEELHEGGASFWGGLWVVLLLVFNILETPELIQLSVEGEKMGSFLLQRHPRENVDFWLEVCKHSAKLLFTFVSV